LIDSGKINSQVTQLQQYDIAIQNFKIKYKYLPGDAPTFGGDGNGMVQCPIANCGANRDTGFFTEIRNFWVNTSEMSNFPIKYNGTITGNIIKAGVNIPRLKIGNKLSSVVVGESDLDRPTPFWPQPYYYLGYIIEQNGYLNTANAFTSQEAVSLDQKIDDGIANTGNILAVGGGGGVSGLGYPVNSTAGSGCVVSSDLSKYNLSSTSQYPCSLALKMFSSGG